MPEITPEQALCALMLGTGETQLILDPEVVRAIRGVEIDVEYRQKPLEWGGIETDGSGDTWVLTFRGMPEKESLEQKGMRVPDVPAGYYLGARAHTLGDDHPRRDSPLRGPTQGDMF